MMPAFVRGMLILGLLALLAGMVMVWRSEEKQSDATSHQSTLPISSGKPVGTSTLSHGGPALPTDQSDARDSVSQR